MGTRDLETMEQEIEGQKFVSSRTINLEREQLRVDRETVLRNAEKNYNARREKEEMKVARGDHKWMLPDLDQELDSRKKKKKHKKEKKRKKDKKKDSDSDDDWVESDKNKVDQSKLGRDSFMEFGFIATYSKEDIKPTAKVDKNQEDSIKKAVAASRELNPQMRVESGGEAVAASPHNNRPCHGGQSGVGGLGWLIKAFKRAEDQAKEGNQSLAEIAEKRWGSVETFLGMVSKAKVKASYVDRRLQEELNRLEKEYDYTMDGEPFKQENGNKKPRNDKSGNRDFRKVRSRSRSKERGRRSRSRSRSTEKRRRSRSREFRDARRRSTSRTRNRSRSRSGSTGRRDRKRRSRSRNRHNSAQECREELQCQEREGGDEGGKGGP